MRCGKKLGFFERLMAEKDYLCDACCSKVSKYMYDKRQ